MSTKGWKTDAPKRGKERHELVKRCPDCFLIPEQEKFPVCKVDCSYDCRGIRAAKIRLHQYGYDLDNQIYELEERYCK